MVKFEPKFIDRENMILIIAYLIGSIPFGYLIVRVKAGGDIRETGSGGTGATNVSRRLGKGAGVVTLVLDALKGTTAIMLASVFLELTSTTVGFRIGGHLYANEQGSSWWLAAVAVAVVLGHIFPIWLAFRGGKGVATAVGVFLVLAPIAMILAGVVFLLVVWRTRYVSLGSIVAAGTIPLLILLQHFVIGPISILAPIMTAATVDALLIVFSHRANIMRLVQGTENKFS